MGSCFWVFQRMKKRMINFSVVFFCLQEVIMKSFIVSIFRSSELLTWSSPTQSDERSWRVIRIQWETSVRQVAKDMPFKKRKPASTMIECQPIISTPEQQWDLPEWWSIMGRHQALWENGIFLNHTWMIPCEGEDWHVIGKVR